MSRNNVIAVGVIVFLIFVITIGILGIVEQHAKKRASMYNGNRHYVITPEATYTTAGEVIKFDHSGTLIAFVNYKTGEIVEVRNCYTIEKIKSNQYE